MSEKKVHIRHCLLFLFELKHSAAEAHRQICAALGSDVVHLKTVEAWFKTFRSGDTSLEDKPRSGRPIEVDTIALRQLVESDSSLTTRCMATVLGCSHTSVANQLHSMGKILKFGRWVPHALSDYDRQRRIDHCLSLLSKSRRYDWLDHLICGDEKWCLYVNHTRRRRWVDKDNEPEPSPKADLHPRKVMLSVWWDILGVVHHEFLPTNVTVTSEVYCNQLQRLADKLTQARPQHDKVYFQHDNARPHSAKVTRCKLLELGWELIPHPPYSPDLAPSDYHLFHSLQNHLADKNFDDFQTLQQDIVNFFNQKPAAFYAKGIHDLPARWRQVTENDGHYIVD